MRRITATFAASILFVGLVAGCSSGSASLTGKVWQWTASTTVTPASQSVVPDPQNYTIEFKSDGTFSAKADCNQVSGGYTTTGSGGLTITPGPSTLVACEPDSLGTLYVAGLGLTQSYAIANAELKLTQAGDGTMTFK